MPPAGHRAAACRGVSSVVEPRTLCPQGETALRILAPMTLKQRDRYGEDTGERRVFFRTVFVFELCQTEPLPGVEPVPLDPPREPLTGDSHTHLLAPLEAFAASLGYSVTYEAIAGSAGGWCDLASRRIVIDQQSPGNARVRTLIHECTHALGIDYQHYTRAQAEVIVDTVTFLVSASVGLEVDGETIPYIAGWGEHGTRQADHPVRRDNRQTRPPHRRRTLANDQRPTRARARLTGRRARASRCTPQRRRSSRDPRRRLQPPRRYRWSVRWGLGPGSELVGPVLCERSRRVFADDDAGG